MQLNNFQTRTESFNGELKTVMNAHQYCFSHQSRPHLILTAPTKCLLVLCLLLGTSGCSYLINDVASDIGQNLQTAILTSNDPETVTSAMPAYLLLQDAMLTEQPENIKMLHTTAELYLAYVGLLDDKLTTERRAKLNNKAFQLTLKAVCIADYRLCDIDQLNFQEFSVKIEQTTGEQFGSLYLLAKAWLGWIQSNKGDWLAIAQVAQVKKIILYILENRENFQNGEPYIYLGVLESLIPPALGGRPDLAQQYFEAGLRISDGKNLMIPVAYAQYYARMMFDRELHDRLLNGVLAANPQQSDLTLINTVARQKASELLRDADNYF